MAITLLISEQYLKDNTPFPDNLDVKLILPHIAFAQDGYIENILGSKLYTTIQLAYSAQTLDTYQTELVNLIKPALANRACQKALPFIHVQIRAAGTVKLNSDNQTVQSNQSEMQYLRAELEGRAEFYEEKVTKYLIYNGSNFPDYVMPDTTGVLPSKASPTTCDLYFYPDGYSNCRCGNLLCNGNCRLGYN